MVICEVQRLGHARMIPDYEISLATTDDVQGMLALQEVNLPDKGGSLSVRLTVDWFNDAILKSPPSYVATMVKLSAI